MSYRRQLGWDGESIAKEFLESKGFRFLESNFYTRWGEIDLIMTDAEFLVFVEVKTYRTNFVDARWIINRRKKRNMKRSADWYRVKKQYEGSYRFDLCVCDGEKVVDYIVAMDVLS